MKERPTDQELIPIRQAAEISGLTPRQLRYASEQGRLTREWFSNRLAFRRPEIESLAQGKR